MAFDTLVGNEKIKEMLQKTISTNSILHSYLFTGIEGIGKTLFAREFAKQILCMDSQLKPCGRCKSCKEMENHNHPDFMQVEQEGAIKIEQIRSMQKKIMEKPIVSNRKVYIIKDADTMTKEAQNCLLKTLEEPPNYITIILIATNEMNLLNTIKSRCISVPFQPIEREKMQKFLCKHLHLKAIPDAIVTMSMGSIGKALQLEEKKEIYQIAENFVQDLDKNNQLELLKKGEMLKSYKEEMDMVLDNIVVQLLLEARQKEKPLTYLNTISLVEDTKKKLKANSNLDMTIDYMIFRIGKERKA